MIHRRMDSFWRRLRSGMNNDEYEYLSDNDQDDDDDNDRLQNIANRFTTWLFGPETSRNLRSIYRERRRERQREQQEQGNLSQYSSNNHRNPHDLNYEHHHQAYRQQVQHNPQGVHYQYRTSQHFYRRRRHQRRHPRRREQQIVWENRQQIDVLLNLVDTFSQFNPIFLLFGAIFCAILVFQTQNVLYYRRQWAVLTDFFSISGLTDRNHIEQFTDEFGCYTLISCINIIISGSLFTLQQQQTGSSLLFGTEFPLFEERELNSQELSMNRKFIQQNYYSQALALAAVQKKEQLIVKEFYEKENIPFESQKHFSSLFYIENLFHLTSIFDSIEHSSQSPTKITFQNLGSLERQMLRDLAISYKAYSAKFCSDTYSIIQEIHCVRNLIWKKILQNDIKSQNWNIGRFVYWTMLSFGLGALLRYSEDLLEWVSNIGNLFRRDVISSSRTFIRFDFESPTQVENTLMFYIQFFKRNNESCEVMPDDDVIVDVSNQQRVLRTTIERSKLYEWQVWFPARTSGDYQIRVIVNGKHVKNSPFHLRLIAGEPSASNIRVINYSSSIVTSPESQTNLLEIELRDKYDNSCINTTNFDTYLSEFTFDVRDIATNQQVTPLFVWELLPQKIAHFALFWTLPSYGMYQAEVFYQQKPIVNGRFQILSLSPEEAISLEEYSGQDHDLRIHNFEAKLLPTFYSRSNSTQLSPLISKSKSVTCYLSTKQIVIKDYFLKFIPRRIATIRVCPSTKLYFARDYLQDTITAQNTSASTSTSISSPSSSSCLSANSEINNDPLLRCPDKNQFVIIDDGSQNPYELLIPQRNIFVTTYSKILLKNIGGSETFHDKESYFFKELTHFHGDLYWRENFIKNCLLIKRDGIVETTMNFTKNYTVSMWRTQFDITFIGEEGVDYGGLRKEWFDLLCKELFEPKDSDEKSLFRSFTNNKQGFVHPNSNCTMPLSYYEFAGKIVGKCLVDTALGSGAKFLVNARFTRSFLLQLIGLGVNYRHFETDDPELFVSKVQFLLENDIGDFELYFTEDEYNSEGKLIKTFDLIPKGSKIRVNDQNKRDYLTKLAQHRLSTRVNDRIEAFLRGLNFLIPDHLLSIFDANELELLICGAETYSLSDLRLHHEFQGLTSSDNRILSWFWKSLSSFSDEEMARLLQFTTGSSRLPALGFSGLQPSFNIMISPDYCFGKLPVAHTCFNQICLPDYDSFKEFDRCLRTAITEGNQGFGFS